MENLQKKMRGMALNTVLELLEKDNNITAHQLKDILAERYPKSNWESIFVNTWLIEFCLKGVLSYKICKDSLLYILDIENNIIYYFIFNLWFILFPTNSFYLQGIGDRMSIGYNKK